ncbi:MAG: hypothetical protein JWR84_3425 [Caulobacter sp.]|nr:hypothetical protein [Caulobacter sp.]
MTEDDPTEVIVAFIRSLGIAVEARRLEDAGPLPGMGIRKGVIVYDPDQAYAPGDLLHEAGHLAVSDPARRDREPFDATPAEEMMATAWSWAAGRHLGLPSRVVFHPPSFQEWGDTMRENFDEGRYVGVPGLQRFGMSIEPRQASPDGPPPFPHMLRWLR